MIEKQLSDVAEKMDLERTNELFDITIARADFKSKEPFKDDNDIKKARVVVQMGNIHINTAKTKMSAIRLIGYQNNLSQLKNAVQRKVRNARKYGK